MEIDYLGVDPAKKNFRQVRRFLIGKIYLINRRAGRACGNLAEEVGKAFGVSTKSVYMCAKFARECREVGKVPKTPTKVEWFETDIDEDARDAKRREAQKRNSAKRKMLEKQRRHARRLEVINYKGGMCADCGLIYDGKNGAKFEFHHRNPKEKEFVISAHYLAPWESLVVELDKCDLLCSNCHNVITNGEY